MWSPSTARFCFANQNKYWQRGREGGGGDRQPDGHRLVPAHHHARWPRRRQREGGEGGGATGRCASCPLDHDRSVGLTEVCRTPAGHQEEPAGGVGGWGQGLGPPPLVLTRHCETVLLKTIAVLWLQCVMAAMGQWEY